MENWQKDIVKAQLEQVDSLFKSISGDIEGYDNIVKSRAGIYENTPENRKLGRVGQKYGSKKVIGNEGESDKELSKFKPIEIGQYPSELHYNRPMWGVKFASGRTIVAAGNSKESAEKLFSLNQERFKTIKLDYQKEKERKDRKSKRKKEKVSGDYKLDNDNYEYYVRFSDHIEEDLKRGWSSWNFGGGGVNAKSVNDLYNKIKDISKEGGEFQISGFNIWVDDESTIKKEGSAIYIDDYEFRELYDGYWVAVDNVNTQGGLSAHALPDDKEDIDDMKSHIESRKGKYTGTGDGESFRAKDARVIYSKGRMHILEVG